MTGSSDVFVKIKNEKEKLEIYKYLLESKKEIICKSTNAQDEIFILNPIKATDETIECTSNGLSIPDNSKQKIIIQFKSGDEKFVSQVECERIHNSIFIYIESDLFKLHRREDFRLRLPNSYKAIFHLTKINNSKTDIKAKVLDLSAGGCRIFASRDNSSLKIGDTVMGELVLAKRPSITLTCEVKHIGPDADSVTDQLIGLQFQSISGVSKNRITGIVLDIYRELFSRIS